MVTASKSSYTEKCHHCLNEKNSTIRAFLRLPCASCPFVANVKCRRLHPEPQVLCSIYTTPKPSKMKKFLLVLILVCAFLIIFYGSSKSLMDKSLLVLFQSSTTKSEDTGAHPGEWDASLLNKSAEQSLKLPARSLPLHIFQRSKRLGILSTTNEQNNLVQTFEVSDYNIFVIYTKGNYQIQKKFQLFVHSLIKFASVQLYLHIITDTKSQSSAEEILLQQIRFFRKKLIYRMYDIRDAVAQIADITHVMKPYFSSNPGSYYSDVLFFVSLGLHRIADTQIERAILVDCDVVFRTDVRLLFKEFKHFSNENLFGLAPELTPVYRHILYRYRSMYPKTEFGNPYYPQTKVVDEIYHNGRETHKPVRSNVAHGYPGLNSGVVLLDLKKIRNSQIYMENLKEEQVRHLSNKYYFKGHLGDQDFYTLLGYEFPSLIYRLDCVWNRQLCTWWKEHGYSDVFDTYFHCEGEINLYHGNCNTRIPE